MPSSEAELSSLALTHIGHHALDRTLIEQPHCLFRVVVDLLEDEIRVEVALSTLI